jgi:hypothetical protein
MTDWQRGWKDLIWLVSHGYEVSIEAGDRRTNEVSGADVAVRLDRHYLTDVYSNDHVEAFWGGEHGTEGALAAARAWAVEQERKETDGDDERAGSACRSCRSC